MCVSSASSALPSPPRPRALAAVAAVAAGRGRRGRRGDRGAARAESPGASPAPSRRRRPSRLPTPGGFGPPGWDGGARGGRRLARPLSQGGRARDARLRVARVPPSPLLFFFFFFLPSLPLPASARVDQHSSPRSRWGNRSSGWAGRPAVPAGLRLRAAAARVDQLARLPRSIG